MIAILRLWPIQAFDAVYSWRPLDGAPTTHGPHRHAVLRYGVAASTPSHSGAGVARDRHAIFAMAVAGVIPQR